MEEFIAEIRVRFQAESVASAGASLRRLSEAAHAVGFDLESGKVYSAPPKSKNDDGGSSYAPLVPEQ
jgi:hypothetical protein